MAEPWIRVHANLISKPVIRRAVEQLGISRAAAIGHLVTFWGSVSQHTAHGQVAHFSDGQIEDWAGWSGRRKGEFARFIRQFHVDAQGRVNEWDDYAGALETRREKERERLRNKRSAVREPLCNTDADVAQQKTTLQPARAVRNDTNTKTRRNETELQEPVVPVSAADFAIALSVAANRGLAEHGKKPQPIPRIIATAARSLEAAEDLLKAGVPLDVAQREAYRIGRTHDAEGVVNSLRYFVQPIIRAHELSQATSDSADWVPPSEIANGTPHRARAPANSRAAAMGGARNDPDIDRWLAKHEKVESQGAKDGE